LRKRLRTTVAAVVGVVSLLWLALEAPAVADPFGGDPGGFPYRADSADHWYCFYSNIVGGDRSPYDAAMVNLDSQTEMWDVYTPTCGTSTDVMFLHNPSLGIGVFGQVACVRFVSGSTVTCDAFWAATNNPEYLFFLQAGDAPLSVHVNQNIRHELGHTTGLTHNGLPPRR